MAATPVCLDLKVRQWSQKFGQIKIDLAAKFQIFCVT